MARKQRLASGNSVTLSPGHKQTSMSPLPSRGEVAQLSGGDAAQRSINGFAQQSPMIMSPAFVNGRTA